MLESDRTMAQQQQLDESKRLTDHYNASRQELDSAINSLSEEESATRDAIAKAKERLAALEKKAHHLLD